MGGALPLDALDAMVEIAARWDLLAPGRRELILASLSPALRSTLARHDRPRDQFHADVIALNAHWGPPPSIVGVLTAMIDRVPDPTDNLQLHTYRAMAYDAWFDRFEAASDAPRPIEPSRFSPGVVFEDRFELIEVLSDSLFSLVWRATDTRHESQEVALKIHKHPLDDAGRKRLIRGARHLYRMSHPNLVRVFDSCSPDDDATPFYYWMEYLPGGDLHRAVSERRLVGRAALDALIGAAEGLAASHAHEVWHRDVKPENILLGADGRPRLADFDLLHHPGASEATGRLASVAFAAPEALADLRQADHRSDIFGLGRSAQYILFAEQHPDLDPEALGSRWAHAVMTGVGDVALRCASDVQAILERATAVDPDMRHASVRHFIQELSDALNDDGSRLGRRFVLGPVIDDRGGCARHLATDNRRLDPAGRPMQVVVERFDAARTAAIDAAFPGTRWSALDLGLCHDRIIPVRARGRDHGGCYWQVVDRHEDARTLEAALAALVDETRDPFEALITLGNGLSGLAEALAYAHGRSIVHRAVHPDRISIAGGRALLGGWTLATRRDDDAPEASAAQDMAGFGRLVQGVAEHLPPLTDRTAGMHPAPAVCAAARTGVDEAIGTLMALARSLCDGAPPPAAEVVRAVDGWCEAVEGRRRLALAEEARAQAHRKQAQADRIRRSAREALGRLHPWDPAHLKEEPWADEDRARGLREEARRLEGRWLGALHDLIGTVPEARQRLVDAFLVWLAEADEAEDRDTIARLESQLAVYADDPRVQAALAPHLRVTFEWSRADAQVSVARVVERRRLLVDGEAIELRGPGRATLDLARGDYRVTWRGPDGATARWPLRIRRNGSAGGRRVHLDDAPLGGLRPGEIYVPAGPFIAGGGEEVVDGMPRQVVHLDAFVMQQRPVTHGAYLDFLAALVADGRGDEAERYVPRGLQALSGRQPASLYEQDAAGRWILPAGSEIDRAHPVANVNWYGAHAFAAHCAARAGLPWRLPRELEWEKAARGVDGRACPWGHRADESFGNVVNSQGRLAAVLAVDAYPDRFPADVSPYGVEGLGGNMRTWCHEPWRRGGPRLDEGGPDSHRLLPLTGDLPAPDTLMVIRGAAFSTPRRHMRVANRYADPAERWPTTAGIRLVRSIGLD